MGQGTAVLRRRSVVLATAVAIVVAPVFAGVAWADAPATPVPVAPANGAVDVPTTADLQVAVSDPEGGTLDVRYFGRPAGATVPDGTGGPDFTLAVIPDTQNYGSVARSPIMFQQTQWLVANRTNLNLAFVSHLGDIVGTSSSATQWGYANQAMGTLDNAGQPSSVVPGNHDFDDQAQGTGPATLYRQTFPPSRYAQASWNSPAASYGGYLGQNLFGPDPVNRENLDNFALFTAGGLDFLVLNLEFNAPDYAIDWAKKVLAAHPQRRAIVVTHSFIDITGTRPTTLQRPGGNSPAQMWDKLVAPTCSIFMVLSGHFHDGDQSEARRTDNNACGQPVIQAVSDYQDRANGGNGWLRYYTFKPSLNQIQAVTYSPYLNAVETDADSAFTLPYSMVPTQPAPFVELGRVSAASGTTASLPWSGLSPGTAYEWYATVSDGTTTTTGPTRSFTTAAPPPPAVLASDSFSRSVSAEWGTADIGGRWVVGGGTTRFSVTGGAGVQSPAAGGTTTATLTSVASTRTDTTVRLRLDAIPNAPASLYVVGRRVGADEYAGRVRVLATGAVELHATRNGSAIAGGAVPGLVLAPGQQLHVRTQVDGTSPTTLRVRAWRAGTAEPSTWQVVTTDATPSMQAAGAVRLSTYLSSAATGGPLTVRYDDLTVGTVGAGPPPPNAAPIAAFTTTGTGLTVSADAAASSDPDGTISSYAWTFGDGSAAVGVTAARTYAAAGTYPVTLTVTDDDGATDVETKQVVVTGPPSAVVLATDRFARTASGGWGAAESGGPWSVSGSTSRYSVTGGAGVQTAAAAATTSSRLDNVSSSRSETSVRFVLDTAPNGPVSVSVVGRRIGSAEYAARVKVAPNGGVELHVTRNGTAVGGGALAGVGLTPGTQFQVRMQVDGTSPTVVRARTWRVGTPEPATWQVSATDSTAGLQAPGGVGLSTYLSSSTTSGPVTIRFDDLVVTPLG